MDQSALEREERYFAKMHAQDGSPRQLIRNKIESLKNSGVTEEEMFTKLKKDFNKHFTDEEINAFIDE